MLQTRLLMRYCMDRQHKVPGTTRQHCELHQSRVVLTRHFRQQAPQDGPLKTYTVSAPVPPAQYVTLGDDVVMVGPAPGGVLTPGTHASHWLWPLLALLALGAIIASVAWAYSKRRQPTRYHDLHDTEMAMMRRPNP